MTEVRCKKCAQLFEPGAVRTTGVAGATAGATLGAMGGAHVGLAGGPLGAMAGTIPGALVGGAVGFLWADRFVTCQHCRGVQWL